MKSENYGTFQWWAIFWVMIAFDGLMLALLFLASNYAALWVFLGLAVTVAMGYGYFHTKRNRVT